MEAGWFAFAGFALILVFMHLVVLSSIYDEMVKLNHHLKDKK